MHRSGEAGGRWRPSSLSFCLMPLRHALADMGITICVCVSAFTLFGASMCACSSVCRCVGVHVTLCFHVLSA